MKLIRGNNRLRVDGDIAGITVGHLQDWIQNGFSFTSGGESLFGYLLRIGRLPLVQWMLSPANKNPETTVSSWGGESSALLIAARNGHIPLVEWLMGLYEAKNLTDSGEVLMELLHVASLRGHLPLVRWLVNVRGADVDAVDLCGRTPLHRAAREGFLPVVQFLVLEGKIDTSAVDSEGVTALLDASAWGQFHVVQWMLSEEGGVELTNANSFWPCFTDENIWKKPRSDEEVSACLKQALMHAAPTPTGVLDDEVAHIVDLVRRADNARPVVAEWREEWTKTVVSACGAVMMPSALTDLVVGYAKPDLDETFDGAALYGQLHTQASAVVRGGLKRRRDDF